MDTRVVVWLLIAAILFGVAVNLYPSLFVPPPVPAPAPPRVVRTVAASGTPAVPITKPVGIGR